MIRRVRNQFFHGFNQHLFFLKGVDHRFNYYYHYLITNIINPMTETANLSDIIQLQSNKVELPNKQYPRKDSQSLMLINSKLKRQNQTLKKELQSFSSQLDKEIGKKTDERGRRSQPKNQDVNYQQLKNAYKQCDIYKKQVTFCKKKLAVLNEREAAVNGWELRVGEVQKENQQLRDELKYLKRVNRKQEKGLEEQGLQEYLIVSKDKQNLQQQVRRLNKQLQFYKKNNRANSPGNQIAPYHKHNISASKGATRSNSNRKRIHTLHNQDVARSQLVILKEKVKKDRQKLMQLTAERERVSEKMEDYRNQLEERGKQIDFLKEKIESLKKKNKLLQTEISIIRQHSQQTRSNSIRPQRSKYKSSHKTWALRKQLQSRTVEQHLNYQHQSQGRIVKWSHEIFASKMKQLHVIVHQQGHILDIHAQYQKGSPRKYNNNYGEHSALVCAEGQYITHLSGCFSDGYLQCLAAITSQKRIQVYGNAFLLEMDEEGEKFQYCLEGQYGYGTLMGQNDQRGVRKLGCRMEYS